MKIKALYTITIMYTVYVLLKPVFLSCFIDWIKLPLSVIKKEIKKLLEAFSIPLPLFNFDFLFIFIIRSCRPLYKNRGSLELVLEAF